ncbi:MAG: MarR family transcriptional regulator [Dehalococcoidia bacterium]
MKELPESEINNRLSNIVDDVMMLFPVIVRKVLFNTMMKTKIGSSDMQTIILEGLATGEMMPSEISKIYCISRPNVTTLVDKLIDKGYAQRLHDDKDRRVIKISVTDKGRRLIIKKRRIIKQYVLNTFAKLDPDEITEISKSLETQLELLTKLNNIM